MTHMQSFGKGLQQVPSINDSRYWISPIRLDHVLQWIAKWNVCLYSPSCFWKSLLCCSCCYVTRGGQGEAPLLTKTDLVHSTRHFTLDILLLRLSKNQKRKSVSALIYYALGQLQLAASWLRLPDHQDLHSYTKPQDTYAPTGHYWGWGPSERSTAPKQLPLATQARLPLQALVAWKLRLPDWSSHRD